MSRASKHIYHPQGNADSFKTVEATLDELQFGSTAKIGGDVGSTNNRLVRASGTGGKTIKGSGADLDDSGNLTISGTATIGGAITSGGTAVPVVATAAQYQANTSGNLALLPSIVWTAAGYTALTDAATISVDMSTGINFSVTIAGNRTLGNPSNAKVGQSGVIKVTASGATRTIDRSANYKSSTISWPISIASGQTAYLSYFVDGTSSILVTGVLNNPT